MMWDPRHRVSQKYARLELVLSYLFSQVLDLLPNIKLVIVMCYLP